MAGVRPSRREGNPYPGPKPFEAGDRSRFFGRDREAADLFSLLHSQQLVLLYAQSGAGKTSLLNAKLLPDLRDSGWNVLPVARLRGLIPKGFSLAGASNVYCLNTLLGWSEQDADATALSSETLSEFLARHREPLNEDGYAPSRVAVFDQLEELFAFYPEHWQQREGFLRQLAEAMDADRGFRVLLVLREDYLANLEPLAHVLPGRLRTRYRLERLGPAAAVQAVACPLEGTRVSFHKDEAHDVAQTLVDRLRTTRVRSRSGDEVDSPHEYLEPYIEPMQLQIVCQTLWNNLGTDVAVITEAHLHESADVDRALGIFYDAAIRLAVERTGVDEEDLRQWFSKTLITPAHTRGTAFRGPSETADIPNAAVDLLETEGLVRAEYRAGARWYEIPHDRFVDVIRTRNDMWWAQHMTEFRIGARGSYTPGDSHEAEVWHEVGRRVAFLKKSLAGAALAAVTMFLLTVWGLFERGNRQTAEDRSRAELLAVAARVDTEEDAERAVLLALEALSFEQRARTRPLPRFARFVGGALSRVGIGSGNQADGMGDPRAAITGVLEEALTRWPLPAVSGLHRDSLTTLAIAPTGRRIATVDHLGRAVLWGTLSGAPLDTLNDPSEPVRDVAFSPDGSRLAAGREDGSVTVWDEATGRVLLVLGEPPDTEESPLVSVAFSPDRGLLAGGRADGTLLLWDASTGDSIHARPEAHPGPIQDLAFSGDGSRLATAGSRGTVHIWDVTAGLVPRTAIQHGRPVHRVALDGQGARAFTVDDEGTAREWYLGVGNGPPFRVDAIPDVRALALAEDGAVVLGVARGRDVELFDTRVGLALQRIPGYGRDVADMAFVPDGRGIATIGRGGSVRVHASERILSRPLGSPEIVRIDLSEDGRYFTATNEAGAVELQDLELPTRRGIPLDHYSPVRDVSFARAENSSVATVGQDGIVRIWSVETGLLRDALEVPPGHGGDFQTVTYSPDGTSLAAAGNRGPVWIWNADGQSEARSLGPSQGLDVTALAYDPTGSRLAVGTADGALQLWDPNTLEFIRTVRPPGVDPVWSIDFASAGTSMAAAFGEAGAFVWDLTDADDAPARVLAGVQYAVQFAPDASWLAVGGNEGVRVWDFSSDSISTEVEGLTDPVSDLRVSGDGRALFIATFDGQVRVTSMHRSSETRPSWVLALRRLTGDECRTAYGNDCTESLSGALAIARSHAVEGDVGRALAEYRRALRGLELDVPTPDSAARALAASTLEERAWFLARRGDLEASARTLRPGEGLDPDRAWPTPDALRMAAGGGAAALGRNLALSGDTIEAIAAFAQAVSLDPTLELVPSLEARTIAVASLLGASGHLMASGDYDRADLRLQEAGAMAPESSTLAGAVQIRELLRVGELLVTGDELARGLEMLRRAIEFDASLALSAAQIVVDRGLELAQRDSIEQALFAYAGAEELAPDDGVDALAWNDLCWYGSLWNRAAQVQFACHRALEEVSADDFYYSSLRDSQGLANALLGDYVGAVADFQVFADSPYQDPAMKALRLQWIRALQSGRSPFTDEVLADLRRRDGLQD